MIEERNTQATGGFQNADGVNANTCTIRGLTHTRELAATAIMGTFYFVVVYSSPTSIPGLSLFFFVAPLYISPMSQQANT